MWCNENPVNKILIIGDHYSVVAQDLKVVHPLCIFLWLLLAIKFVNNNNSRHIHIRIILIKKSDSSPYIITVDISLVVF